MIELYVIIISLIFLVYLITNFFSGLSLLLNIALIFTILLFVSKDLKKVEFHKYYIISLFLASLFFILSSTIMIKSILKMTNNASISLFTLSIILIYINAHVVKLSHSTFEHGIKRVMQIINL